MLAPINLDLAKSELRNAKVYPLTAASITTLASSLGSGDKGFQVYDTTNLRVGFWNGTSFDYPTISSGITSVSGTSPVSVSTVSGAATVSMPAAGASQDGYMVQADYNTLHAATNANTAGTIVKRDGSGNFSAGTITAALTGTASNATNLNNQPDTYYLNRANHTGTQLASTISNFDTQVRTSRLDQMAAPTASVSMGSQTITNLGTPVNATDAATKAYVDATAQGMVPKGMVRAATGTNQTLSGLPTVDGVTLVANDLILLIGQTTASQNGPWVVASGAWARPANFSTSAQAVPGSYWFVSEGGFFGNTGWWLTTDNPITLGTTSLTITQFAGPNEFTGGNGISISGNTINALGTTNRISVGATIDIASTYVGQTSITTLGTITTGVWTGTAIAVANGGTGSTTASGARSNLGATTLVNGTLTGDGTTTNFNITHNLAINHTVQIFDSSQNLIIVDVTRAATTDVVKFAAAPANGVQYLWTAVG